MNRKEIVTALKNIAEARDVTLTKFNSGIFGVRINDDLSPTMGIKVKFWMKKAGFERVDRNANSLKKKVFDNYNGVFFDQEV